MGDEEGHDPDEEHKDERTTAGQQAVEHAVSRDGLPYQGDRDICFRSGRRHPETGCQDGHRPPRSTRRRPIAPERNNVIPNTTTHQISAGGPVLAREAAVAPVGEDRPTAASELFELDDVGDTVPPVVPELALEPELAVVVVVVPELGATRNGAENTLGAVKSF
jgi:hypothetical protein